MGDINASYNWAIDTCNRPDVGYSQAYRDQQTVDGITYYDCSSFIWYALKAGGFVGIGNSPFVTANMRGILTSAGFTEYDAQSVAWEPGDIVWRKGHTEMVYDDHITMGAHTAHAPLADQVSIRDRPVSNTAFTRILKYGGAAPTPPPTPGGGTGNFSQSTSFGNIGKEVLKVTSKEIIKAFQSILKANGYYKGQIDGLMGPLTREALRKAGVK